MTTPCIPVPPRAVDRIVRNPHLLPRMPPLLLADVHRYRHSERMRRISEEGHVQRRLNIDQRRLERIAQHLQASSTVFDIDVDVDIDRDPAISSTYSHLAEWNRFPYSDPSGTATVSATSPTNPVTSDENSNNTSHTKSSINTIATSPPINHRRRSDTTTATAWSYTVSPIKPRHYSASYFPPRKSSTVSLPVCDSVPASSAVNTTSTPPSIDVSLVNSFSHRPVSHTLESILTSARRRSQSARHPLPADKHRDFFFDRQGNPWRHYPSWHSFMRGHYLRNGQYPLWARERACILRDLRRGRRGERDGVWRRKRRESETNNEITPTREAGVTAGLIDSTDVTGKVKTLEDNGNIGKSWSIADGRRFSG
ncbi:hypothetical protein NADFUDRAFT_39585 [Nadsonia fulvescens var. elongata DSM 6958]|uniref:Uncharacterized protein n=1 Tax=Nadsonia fulvescens var. elongata DSM 6958 TaxID=857566 RepID=A0A1E3PRY8_9ASCO|nr:hypothetical protein NADFUDRAFT_39585 [Nadsonia fulvescens var. elongata DSM 6958]